MNMLTRKVQQTNQTKSVAIPAHLCTLLNIERGTVLKIELDGRKIIMAPVTGDQPRTGASQA
jgi:antitoxin component of MazEF toxin-antitoxin module